MRILSVIWGPLLLLVVLAQTACVNLGGGGTYNEAVKKEARTMVSLYRKCLQRYEGDPTKAKENCALYREAMQELAPPEQRSSLSHAFDRVLGAR